MNETELYEIYNRTIGKVRSGTVITGSDYGRKTAKGFLPFPEDGGIAVTVAVDDVKQGGPTRTKSELAVEVKRRLG